MSTSRGLVVVFDTGAASASGWPELSEQMWWLLQLLQFWLRVVDKSAHRFDLFYCTDDKNGNSRNTPFLDSELKFPVTTKIHTIERAIIKHYGGTKS